METFYICFIAGGTVLPVLSVIAGAFGGHGDIDGHGDIGTHGDCDIDHHIDIGHHHFDFGHHDTDMGSDSMGDTGSDTSGISVGFLPTSLLAISTLALLFGTTGELMTIANKNLIFTFVIALVVGYIGSVIVQTLINTLKKLQVNNYSMDSNEILMYDGTVIEAILPGALGTVSFKTLKGILVSYPARSTDPNERISSGKVVVVKELKDGVCFVELKNKYE